MKMVIRDKLRFIVGLMILICVNMGFPIQCYTLRNPLNNYNILK